MFAAVRQVNGVGRTRMSIIDDAYIPRVPYGSMLATQVTTRSVGRAFTARR